MLQQDFIDRKEKVIYDMPEGVTQRVYFIHTYDIETGEHYNTIAYTNKEERDKSFDLRTSINTSNFEFTKGENFLYEKIVDISK